MVTSTRLGRGSIKSHVRTVKVLGMGLFAYWGFFTPLSRCNTLDFVPKSCAKGAAPPLESLLTSPVGDVDSPHRKLSQRRTRLSAARRRHFCGSVITPTTTLSALRSAKCSGLSEGERLYRVRFGRIAAYVRTGGWYARTQ